MLGRRSLNPVVEPIDCEIDRTFRENLRNQLVNQNQNQNQNQSDNQDQIENQNFNMGEEGERRTMRDYSVPFQFNSLSCITLLPTQANHFELKPGVIQLLPTFYGLEKEDPYLHVKEFLDICATFKFQNFSDESIKLRLFPFSLKDKAKAWLNSLEVGSISTWEVLVKKFLNKYFSIHKMIALRRKINVFVQKDGENFNECWERWKDLLLKCPHYGFEK